jgi:uncharacterized protein YyaL (SSP411 family)
MERETFEDEAVATFMNENFINVKVDREEHPDIDKTYVKAVQLMTGNAGWPLNCITLPNGEPIWGGTYLTKEDWMKALQQIVRIYQDNPESTSDFAKKLTTRINEWETFSNATEVNFPKTTLKDGYRSWSFEVDWVHGGFKGDEKFPMPSNYNFLLRHATTQKDTIFTYYVHRTLNKIATRGLFDHLEGGFSRYSTDEQWNIPHFEKMLYDNAQLISTFATAYQKRKKENYKNAISQTIRFVNKQLRRDDGLLYASLNADSLNEKDTLEEGAYYTWKKETLQTLIGEDFQLFSEYYGLDDIPKTEHQKHVLVKRGSNEYFAEKNKLTLDEVKEKQTQWEAILLKERKNRKAPKTDTKVITSWNALMLKAYADAYKVFGEENFKAWAIQTGRSIKEKLITKDGKIFRSLQNSTIHGYLDDYAYLIDAFLNVYQITFDEQWLHDAKALTDYTLEHFYDEENKLFAFKKRTSKGLTFKEFDVEDGTMPSANSVMAHNLFKLKSKQMLQRVLPNVTEYPFLYANWVQLYLNLSEPYYEVVINGKDALAKAKEFHQNYAPNSILCGSTSESKLPLLENRFYEDKTFIYVCVNRVCQLPTESVEKAISLMK